MRLDLHKLLNPQNILLAVEAETKVEIIEKMIGRLVQTGLIADEGAALQAVLHRERSMSTGLEEGVAVPHGKTDSVEKLACALAITKDGIEFDSADGKPARIIIMTVSPANRSGPHIQFLAEITGLLRDAGRRERLLKAQSADEVLSTLKDQP